MSAAAKASPGWVSHCYNPLDPQLGNTSQYQEHHARVRAGLEAALVPLAGAERRDIVGLVHEHIKSDPYDASTPEYRAFRAEQTRAIQAAALTLNRDVIGIVQDYTRSLYSFQPRMADGTISEADFEAVSWGVHGVYLRSEDLMARASHSKDHGFEVYDPKSTVVCASFGNRVLGFNSSSLILDENTIITLEDNSFQEGQPMQTILTAYQVIARGEGEARVVRVSCFSLHGHGPFMGGTTCSAGTLFLLPDNYKIKGGVVQGKSLAFGPPRQERPHAALPAPTAKSEATYVSQNLLDLIDELLVKDAVKANGNLVKVLQDKRKEVDDVHPNLDLSNTNAVFFNHLRGLLDENDTIKPNVLNQLLGEE